MQITERFQTPKNFHRNKDEIPTRWGFISGLSFRAGVNSAKPNNMPCQSLQGSEESSPKAKASNSTNMITE